MLPPKTGAVCSNGVRRDEQPLEVRLTIQKAEACPGQLVAWRRLWAKLLAAPTTTAAVDRTEEKAIVCQFNL